MPNAINSDPVKFDSTSALERFINERCELLESYHCPKGDFYQAYREFASGIGVKPVSMNAVGSELKAKPYIREHRTKVARVWEGIRLKNQALQGLDETQFPKAQSLENEVFPIESQEIIQESALSEVELEPEATKYKIRSLDAVEALIRANLHGTWERRRI
jgi:hypothetical protein